MNRKLLISVLIVLQSLISFAQDVSFTQRSSNSLAGDITFASNTILVNTDAVTVNNEDAFMEYLDADDADTSISQADRNSTFSSSSAQLAIPACSEIVYAGLYWSGIYPYDTWSSEGDPTAYNAIKFKLPGQNYQDITADDTHETGIAEQRSYVCFKDITTDLTALGTAAAGEYYAANIRATTGRASDASFTDGIGSAAGWVMVVVYKDPSEPIKNISIFDGFTTLDDVTDETIVAFSDFLTIPDGGDPMNPNPVNVDILTAAIGGDNNKVGDSFQIETPIPNVFSDISTGSRAVANFFNGTISPGSETNFAFDVDLFELTNTNNSIVGNDQNSLRLRYINAGGSTNVYFPFLTAVAVETVSPDIQLVKTIDDGGSGDLSNATLDLGTELWYDISFQNIGNDDAINTIITDVLPEKVDLLSYDPLPAGVTLNTYDEATRTLTFNVDNSLVLGDGSSVPQSIRINVQVVKTCNEIVDFCSNVVENQAFISYEGATSGLVTNSDPSLSENLDPACSIGTPDASTFFIDATCVASREEVLCGSSLELEAGDGYDTYQWTNAGGTDLGDTQSITVTTPGVYSVVKTGGESLGCISIDEVITVVSTSDITDPIQEVAHQVVQCITNPSLSISEFYLCGSPASVDLTSGVTSASDIISVNWQQLATSCTQTDPLCPETSSSCWENMDAENDVYNKTFTEAGNYRLVIIRANGCGLETYYFNTFKASFGAGEVVTVDDSICSSGGSININNVPVNLGYEYAVVADGVIPADGDYTAIVAAENVFPVSAAQLAIEDTYDVYIRTQGTTCTYEFQDNVVGVVDLQDSDVDITYPATALCYNSTIEIDVEITSAIESVFTYTLVDDTNTTVGTPFISSDKTHKFTPNGGGPFRVLITTDEGCNYTSELIEVTVPDQLEITAITTKNIDCTSGIISLTGEDGTPNYDFAIWSYTPATGATKAAINPPADASGITEFLSTNINYNVGSGELSIASGEEGEYVFILFDINGCDSVSSSVEVELEGEPLTINASAESISCNGVSDGSITVDVTDNTYNYTLEYSINGGTDYQSSNIFTNLAAGDYTVTVRTSNGNGFSCPPIIADPDPVTVEDKTPLTANNATITQAYTRTGTDCSTIQLGEITFQAATGGTPPYSYGLNGLYQTGLVFDNLTDDLYILTVRDANGCEIRLSNRRINPLVGDTDFDFTVDYNCSGDADEVIITPVDSSYTYTLNGDSNNTGIFTNVPEGNHLAEINYNDGNCTRNLTITVESGQEIRGEILEINDSECNGSNNGSVKLEAFNFDKYIDEYQVSADGGVSWSTTGDNPYTFIGLESGPHEIRIRQIVDLGNPENPDDPSDPLVSDCNVLVGTINIEEPEQLYVTYTETTPVTCTSPDGASILVEGFGGIPPYEFSVTDAVTGNIIADWQTSTVIEGLSEGNYNINIRDSRFCTECGCTTNPFENGGFEDASAFLTNGRYRIVDESLLTGWETTAPDNKLELWQSGFNGVTSYEGSYHAELNANASSLDQALYQEFCTREGDVIEWQVAHRGRSGTDEAEVRIGGSLATAVAQQVNGAGDLVMRTGNTNWILYSGTYTVPPGQSSTVILFEAVSTANGNLSVGNFIDGVEMNLVSSSCAPATIILEEPVPVTHSSSVIQCSDSETVDATISVEALTGAGDYNFGLDNGAGVIWYVPSPVTATTYDFTNLAPGTYDVYVRDGKGCISIASQETINRNLTLSAVPTDETCSSGSIDLSAAGGAGNYVYAVIPSTDTVTDSDFSTATVVNVSAGTYNVYVRDNSGSSPYCATSVAGGVEIELIDNPEIDVTPNQPTCSGGRGSFRVSLSEGVPPYSVTVSSGGSIVTTVTGINASLINIPNLSGGTYLIEVTDANGCAGSSVTESIVTKTDITSTVTLTPDPNCNNQPLTVTFSGTSGGQTTNYEYAVRDDSGVIVSAFSNQAVINNLNLPIGEYDFVVRDGDNPTCEFVVDTIQILSSDLPEFDFDIEYGCNGNARIEFSTVNPSIDITQYEIYADFDTSRPGTLDLVNDVIFFTDQTPENASYTIVDSRGCSEEITFLIENGQGFDSSNISLASSAPACFNATGGNITITVANFGTSFDYLLDDGVTTPTWVTGITSSPYTTTELLLPGNYDVSVRVSNSLNGSCIVTDQVTINNATLLEIQAPTVTTLAGCITGATIEGNATGGTPAYVFEYLLNNTGSSWSTTLTDIPPGTHGIRVTDASGVCTAETTFVIADPVTVEFTAIASTCYSGASDGTIDLNITSGTGPYTATLAGIVTDEPVTGSTHQFSGLGSGTYSITITDSKGCTETESATIIEALSLTIGAIVPETCNPGSITHTATGGTAPYSYEVVTANAAAPAIADYDVATTTSLSAGTYDVYVRDAAGCLALIEDQVVGLIDPLDTSLAEDQPNCFGDTGGFILTITDGASPFDVDFSGGGTTITDLTDTTSRTIDIDTLADGTYDIVITDANGCVETEQVIIGSPAALTTTVGTVVQLSCDSSVITSPVISLGSIEFNVPTTGTAPYTYSIGGAFQSSPLFEGLTAATYTLTVTDNNSCSYTIPTNVVIEDLLAIPDFTIGSDLNCDGTETITLTPPATPALTYEYFLDGNVVANANNVFEDLIPGAHEIVIRADNPSTGEPLCDRLVEITVLDDQEFTASLVGSTEPTCFGDSDGTITINATNFATSYQYSFDGITYTTATSTAGNFIIDTNTISAGSYTIQVRPTGETTDCIITLGPITIGEPDELEIQAPTVTASLTCLNGATIEGNAIGGTPNYTFEYLLNNTGTTWTTDLTNIPAGTHGIRVTDTNSCVDTDTFTINPLNTLAFTAVPSCLTYNIDGTPAGTILVEVTSGNGNYQFILNGNTGAAQLADVATPNEFTFENLGSGTYTIDVVDGLGCTTTQQTVIIGDELTATVEIINVSCNDGSIIITPSGADITTYEYAVVLANVTPANSDYGTNNTIIISSITSDTDYDVYVRSQINSTNTCEFVIEDVEVKYTTPVEISNESISQPVCSGDTGSISFDISNGESPHDLLIENTAGTYSQTENDFLGSNFSFNNLPADTYTLSITDNLGCTDDITNIVIVDPTPIVMDIVGVLPPDCTTVDPAQIGFDFININPVDYLPLILQYSVDNGGTWTDFTDTNGQVRGYNSGDIVFPTLRLSDATGGLGNTQCIETYGQYEIIYNVSGLIVDVSVIDPADCSTGFSVELQGLSGQQPYEYQINGTSGTWSAPTAGSVIFSDLTPGVEYDFFVRDALGCIEKNDDPLVLPPTDFDVDITATVTSESCDGAATGAISFEIDDVDGELDAVPSGDFINWTLYDGNTNIPVAPAVTGTIPGSTTFIPGTPFILDIPNLDPGSYYLIIEKDSGLPTLCTWGSGNYQILETQPISGNLFIVNNITCGQNGIIRIDNIVGGVAPYTFTINNADNFTIAGAVLPTDTTVGNTIEFPYASVIDQTLNVTNISITITDSNGGTATACTSLPLTEPLLTVSQPPVIDTVVADSCSDNNKTITVTLDSANLGTPPYQYSNDGGSSYSAVTTEETFVFDTNINPGLYGIVVRDANGCTSGATTNIVTVYENLEASANVTDNLTCSPANSEITITVTNGQDLGNIAGDFTYTIVADPTTPNGATTPAPSTGTIDPVAGFTTHLVTTAGNYLVTITDITTGCIVPLGVTVEPTVNPVFVRPTPVDATCAGSSTGSIPVNVTTGILPLTYSIVETTGSGISYTTTTPGTNTDQGFWNGSSFINLPSGSYDVTVTGDNGCATTETALIVDDLDPLLVSVPRVTTEFSCNTSNSFVNAVISIDTATEVQDGSGTYVVVELYKDLDSSGGFSAGDTVVTNVVQTGTVYDFTITDLSGGDYYVRVLDSEDCEAYSVTVPLDNYVELDTITVTTTANGALSCPNGEQIDIVFTSTTTDALGATIAATTTGATITIYDSSNTPIEILTGDSGVTITSTLDTVNLEAGTYTITVAHPDTGCTISTTHTVEALPTYTVAINEEDIFVCDATSTDSEIEVSINSTGTAYTGNYTYEVFAEGTTTPVVLTATGQTGITSITGLTAGRYYVRIIMEDYPECEFNSVIFEIEVTTPISINDVTEAAVTCIGGNDGSVTINDVTGGLGGLQYALIAGTDLVTEPIATAFTTDTFYDNLTSGDYVLWVQDTNGCSVSQQLNIPNATQVAFTLSKADNACSETLTGVITVDLSGGTESYTVTVTGATTGVITRTSNVAGPIDIIVPEELVATTYTVSVVDSNNCSAPDQTITINPKLDYDVTTIKGLDCSGTPDATYEIEVLAGSGNYSFDVVTDPGSVSTGTVVVVSTTEATFSIATAGDYIIQVTDINSGNCVLEKPLNVAAPIFPEFTFNVIDATCNGSATGIVEVTTTEGAIPVRYELRDGALALVGTWNATDSRIEDVPAGTYTLTGIGDNDCSFTSPLPVTVGENAVLVVQEPTITSFSCTTENALNQGTTVSINIDHTIATPQVEGGSENYVVVQLYKDDDSSADYNFTSDTEITTVTVTGTVYDFTVADTTGGDYYIRILDSEDCEQFSPIVILPAYDALDTITINAPTPFSCISNEFISISYTSTLSTVTNATVTITDSAGNLEETMTGVDNGVTVTGTVGLTPDSYTIRVTNPLTGCYIEELHTIEDLPNYFVDLTLDDTFVCSASDFDSTLTIAVANNSGAAYTGLYTYEVFESGTTTLALYSDSSPVSGTGATGITTINGVGVGAYDVRITMEDHPECNFETTFEIEIPNVETITSTEEITNVTCIGNIDGSIEITNASGGFGGYEYALVAGSDTTVMPGATAGTLTVGNTYTDGDTVYPFDETVDFFANLPAGFYVVWIRDINGCEMMPPKVVEVENPTPVEFSITKDDNACNSASGVITVTATGGTGDYNITVTGNTSSTVFTRTGSSPIDITVTTAETFTVTVEDSFGCSGTAITTDEVIIYDDVTYDVPLTKFLDCSSTPDATFELTILTGSGNYSYEVFDAGSGLVENGTITGTTPTTITILTTEGAGDYTLQITDIDSGCTVDPVLLTVPQIVEPLFDAVATVNNFCYGSNSGVIQMTPTENGLSPLAYTINGTLLAGGTFTASTTTESQFESLAPGDYIVTATGTNDCTANSAVIEIREVNEITFTSTVSQFGCTTDNVTNPATVSVTSPIGGSNTFDRVVFTFTPNTGTVVAQDSSTLDFSTNDTLGGTVDIVVYDSNGCASAVLTETINPFEPLTAPVVTSTKAIDCDTGENITVTYSPISASVVFEVTGLVNDTSFVVSNATGLFTDLPTDTYQVSVTNTATGCTSATTYTVDSEPSFALSIASNRLCTGENNGSITFDFADSTPYVGLYDYEVYLVGNPTVQASSNDVSGETIVDNLAPGDYYVSVVMDESPFCTVISSEVTLEEAPTALQITNLDITKVNCNATDSGEVTITAEGGWSVYEYELVKTDGVATTIQNFDINNIIQGLEAGDYEVTVRDLEGCTATSTFTLLAPVAFDIQETIVQNNCNGENIASIAINVIAGGQGEGIATNYSFAIRDVGLDVTSSVQNENIFENLTEGQYEVFVFDNTSLGCTYSEIFTITDNPEVEVIATTSDIITCLNTEVTVTLSASGGTGTTYVYSVSNDPDNLGTAITGNTTSVGPGTYYFFATDANGCPSDSFIFQVAPIEDLTAELNVVNGFISCNGDNNGVLSASAEGGLGNYLYTLLDELGNEVQPEQSDDTFYNLGAGSYQIRVTSNDCIDTTAIFEITEPLPLEIVNFEVTALTCIDTNDGTITITEVTGGTGEYTYNISSEPEKFQESNIFQNLDPGMYTVTVQDESGCFESIDVEVVAPEVIVLELVSLTQQVCVGDAAPSAQIAISGGTTPYIITINGAVFTDVTNTGIVTGSGATIYELNNLPVPTSQTTLSLFIDVGSTNLVGESECAVRLDPELVITRPMDLLLEVISEQNCDGTTTITADVDDIYESEVIYSIEASSGAIIANPNNDTGIFIVSNSDTYTITVTHAVTNCEAATSLPVVVYEELTFTVDDSNQNILIVNASGGDGDYEYNIDDGMFSSDNEFTISETRDYIITVVDSRGCEHTISVFGEFITIEVPNFFTPDGDGTNDYWYPINVEDYHNVVVSIFDRYGRQLEIYRGSQQGWDGMYQGKPLPSGDYWYTLEFQEITGQEKKFMGNFTLYRK